MVDGELAHAFGARYDLPIPLYLFVGGGAVVVLLSFAFVVPRAVQARLGDDGLPLLRAPDRPRLRRRATLSDTIALAVLAFVCLCGLFGNQDVPENILPTSFWLLAWIAVPLTCGVIGDWTQPVNPFATLSRLGDSPRARRVLLGGPRPVGWPGWLGWWPAVLLFFLGCLGELVYNVTSTVPHVVATGLLVYSAVCLLMGLLFGRSWRQQGELFTVLFATWGRLGFWRFGAAGRTGFGGGLDSEVEPTASRVSFILLLLISVNFDGLLTTPQWASFERGLPDQIGLQPGRVELFRTAAFAVLAVALFALFAGFAVLSARAASRRAGPRRALAGLVPSLLPIAFGYLFVHNLQYVLINAQLMLPLIGNPIGQSRWPITLPFPFDDQFEPHIHFLPASFYWYVGVAVIVAVHVAAVVVAHRHLAGPPAADSVTTTAGGVTTTAARSEQLARRGEYPWLVAMVAYTMASLWLIAQPFTESKPAPKVVTVAGTVAPASTAR